MPVFYPPPSSASAESIKLSAQISARRAARTHLLAILALFFTGTLLCSLSYLWLRADEARSFEIQYRSVAGSAADSLQRRLKRIQQLTKTAAVVYKYSFPDKKQWPMVAYDGFYELSDSLMEIAGIRQHTMAVLPIVQPQQFTAFETFAEQTYRADPLVSSKDEADDLAWKLHVHNIALNSTDRRYHVTEVEGIQDFDSPYSYAAPLFQTQGKYERATSLMLNTRFMPSRGKLMDSILDCVAEDLKHADKKIGSGFTHFPSHTGCEAGGDSRADSDCKWGGITLSGNVLASPPVTTVSQTGSASIAQNPCSGTTDFIDIGHLARDVAADAEMGRDRGADFNEGRSSIILHPIFAANDPHTVVGFMGMIMSWSALLGEHLFPAHPTGGFDIVIESSKSGRLLTYALESGGNALFKGDGDLHDRDYDAYRISTNLFEDGTKASETTMYSAHIYPNEQLAKAHFTNLPAYAAGFVVLIQMFTMLIFFVFDWVMKDNVSAQQAVLDTKRRFVRFISHEVRTPLNTVELGLQVLINERDRLLDLLKQAASYFHDRGFDVTAVSANDSFEGLASTHLSPSAASGLVRLLADMQSLLQGWHELTDEVMGNCNTAVVVLDDLLNYDKIEMGTMRLEFELLRIWELISDVESRFRLRAKAMDVMMSVVKSPNPYCPPAGKLGVAAGSDTSSYVNAVQAQPRPGEAAVGTEVDWSVLTVLGDNNRLGQVLWNLISNALKFTSQSSTIRLEAFLNPSGFLLGEELANEGNQGQLSTILEGYERAGSIVIAITDTSAGMTEEQLMNMFGEGVQFNANKLQAGGGSGLGLFITKGLVEQHGGRIWASSEGLGKGTTFAIELPAFLPCAHREGLNEVECNTPSTHISSEPSCPLNHGTTVDPLKTTISGEVQPQIQPVPPQQPTPARSTRSRFADQFPNILIVDDAISNRKLLHRLLTAKGFTCHQAVDGLDALRVYEEVTRQHREQLSQLLSEDAAKQGVGRHHAEFFSTILMDFEMPKMDGPTATRELRTKLGCTCLIFGVTGNVLPQDVKLFIEHGADKVIAKPLIVDRLEKTWEDMGI